LKLPASAAHNVIIDVAKCFSFSNYLLLAICRILHNVIFIQVKILAVKT
jgi:hypothetical protein